MINGEVFRLYHQNENLAISRFIAGCKSYIKTSNEDYKKYWQDMIDTASKGEYKIMINNDFLGVRKI